MTERREGPSARAFALFVLAVVLVVSSPAEACASERGQNFSGDAAHRGDIAAIYAYDASQGRIGISRFISGQREDGLLQWKALWASGAGSFDPRRMQTAGQTIARREFSFIAMLYDYGDNHSALFVWTPWSVQRWWESRSFDASRAELTMTKAGQFQFFDGAYEPVALYGYGNRCAIWRFHVQAGPLGMNRSPFYPIEFARCKQVLGGDFDGDGFGDVAIVYDFGDSQTGVWIADGYDQSLQLAWQSARGAFAVSKAKYATGDFDADRKDELVALYDRGGKDAAVFVFDDTCAPTDPYGGRSPHQFAFERWGRQTLPASWRDVQLTPADVTQDGACDLAIFANDVPSRPSMWTLPSDANAREFDAPVESYRAKNWSYERTQLVQ